MISIFPLFYFLMSFLSFNLTFLFIDFNIFTLLVSNVILSLQFNIFNLLISISCSIKLHATAWLKYGKICSLTENNIIIIILHHEKMKISNTISCLIYLLQKYKSGLLFTLMNTITIPNVHVQVIIHPSLRYEFHGVMCLAISA